MGPGFARAEGMGALPGMHSAFVKRSSGPGPGPGRGHEAPLGPMEVT